MKLLSLLLAGASALPYAPSYNQRDGAKSLFHVPPEAFNASFPCFSPYCKKPQKKFSTMLQVKPRIQWQDAGGYCGSLAVQNVALGKGVWISQQKVRDSTVAGGGHDHEILATNIEMALQTLKLKFEGFDYKHQPTPQADAYRRWIKKQLAAGHGIAWMIMLEGGRYPVYPGLPYGYYSHVEPVLGLLSDHPLDDEQWYDDDVVAHGTDASQHTYYRTFESLPAGVTSTNVSECGSDYLGYPCIYKNYGFGWAIQGVQDSRTGVPISLDVDRADEPDTRSGESPVTLHGTVRISALTKGTKYELYRFDGIESAFDYDKTAPTHTFVADEEVFIYDDPNGIPSNGVTYYRCVEA